MIQRWRPGCEDDLEPTPPSRYVGLVLIPTVSVADGDDGRTGGENGALAQSNATGNLIRPDDAERRCLEGMWGV